MNTAATGPDGQRASAARVPHRLLDFLIVHAGLKNDAALARLLAVSPARLSKIRHGKVNISADILLRSHEMLGIPLADLRRLLDGGDVRCLPPCALRQEPIAVEDSALLARPMS